MHLLKYNPSIFFCVLSMFMLLLWLYVYLCSATRIVCGGGVLLFGVYGVCCKVCGLRLS